MYTKNKLILFVLICFILGGVPCYLSFGEERKTEYCTNSFQIPLIVVNVKSEKGSFEDKRDGKIYRQVKIGKQTWMAENLNYGKLVVNMEQSNNKQVEKSYYNNDSACGKINGGLYTWAEAMNYSLPDAKNVVQGICPDGWHLPSDIEWNELCSFLEPDIKSKSEGWQGKNIAIVLVDSSQNKFNSGFGGNAVSSWFFYINNMAYFWTSTPYSSASAYYRCLSKDSKQIYRGAGDIKIGMSVRCIKD